MANAEKQIEDKEKYFKKILTDFFSAQGRSPKRREIKEQHAICYHFGGWNKALEAAKIPLARKNQHSKEELLDSLKSFYNTHGFSPSAQDCNSYNDLFDRNVYIKKLSCNTWGEVLEKADLHAYFHISKYTNLSDSELLLHIKEKLLNSEDTSQEYWNKHHGKLPSTMTLKKRFGNWNKILKLIGIEPKNDALTKEEMKNEITRLMQKLKHTPTLSELKKHSIYSPDRFRYKSSYVELLTSLGFTPRYYKGVEINETNEQLKKQYIEFSKKIGAFNGATCKSLDESPEIYNSGVFEMRFTTLNNLRLQCNYQPINQHPKYSKKQIRELLIKEMQKVGRKLTIKEINSNITLPSTNTILRYFKTTKINEVWKELDI